MANTYRIEKLPAITSSAVEQKPKGIIPQKPRTAGITNDAMRRGLNTVAGIGDLAQMGIGLAQIKDSSPYQMQIDQYSNIADNGVSSYNQLQDMYAENLRGVTAPTADELRGMDTGQKIGSVLSSTLSGASTGAQFGGVGALVGGITGLGAGVAGWLIGDARAKSEADRLAAERERAMERNRIRLGVVGDQITEQNFRGQYAHIGANGGEIKRQTLQEFADRTLKKSRMPASYGERPVAYKRTLCNGGVKISIRTK